VRIKAIGVPLPEFVPDFRFVASFLNEHDSKVTIGSNTEAKYFGQLGYSTEMLCFSPVANRYAWPFDQLVAGQLLLHNAYLMARYLSTVTKLGLHTLQWNCCAYVNTHENLITIARLYNASFVFINALYLLLHFLYFVFLLIFFACLYIISVLVRIEILIIIK